MKTFLIIVPSIINRDELVGYLKDRGISKYWFYSLPAVFINSTNTPVEISDAIRAKYGDIRHFVVSVTDSNYKGWLPADHWPHVIGSKIVND